MNWENNTNPRHFPTYSKYDTANSPMITTLLITKNHKEILPRTLESVKPLGPVVVGDLGSEDGTVEYCKKNEVTVYTLRFDNDYSEVKNTLAAKATTDYLFWLEPGEEVVSGGEYLEDLSLHDMYRALVIKGDLLMKQPRIYRRGSAKFIRPVFEDVEDVAKVTLPVVIGGDTKSDLRSMADCLSLWQSRDALNPEIDYYRACHHLMTGRYDQFLSVAEHYLFQKKTLDASTVMTRYYMASLLKKRNTSKSLKLVMECIAAYPLMAEFWCLLGDIYLTEIKQYDRAYLFYENAMVLGSRRLEEDTMPMEISKYDDYPKKMMGGIKEAIKTVLSTPSPDGSQSPSPDPETV